MGEHFRLLGVAHDEGLEGGEGDLGVEDGGESDFGQGFHHEDASLHIELPMICNHLEELKVKHIETRRMVL